MKCNNCPAFRRVSHEYPDYDCYADVPDEDLVVFKDGQYGCRRTKATIEKQIDLRDAQYDGIGEWAQEEERKRHAMAAAIESAFKHEGLYICCKYSDGSYHEVDAYAKRELPDWLRWAYEEELKKTKEETKP